LAAKVEQQPTKRPAASAQPTAHPTETPAPPREGADERIRRLAQASDSLELLSAQVAECRACELCEARTQTVFGEGAPTARIMFIGEAPGEEEDRQGRPFVGEAGQLLTDIITKGMKLRREDVYIANTLKCHPPEGRDPKPLEKALCAGWLERQIELVSPEVLIPLGRRASEHLLGKEGPMGSLRAQVHLVGGRKVIPTYHPAYLLRTPSEKKSCWADIQLAMAELGLEK
jgi:DNA polymerase